MVNKENTVVTHTWIKLKHYFLMSNKEIASTNDGTWSSTPLECSMYKMWCFMFPMNYCCIEFLTMKKWQAVVGICLQFNNGWLIFTMIRPAPWYYIKLPKIFAMEAIDKIYARLFNGLCTAGHILVMQYYIHPVIS